VFLSRSSHLHLDVTRGLFCWSFPSKMLWHSSLVRRDVVIDSNSLPLWNVFPTWKKIFFSQKVFGKVNFCCKDTNIFPACSADLVYGMQHGQLNFKTVERGNESWRTWGLRWSDSSSGVVVTVFATGPKGRGFKPSRGDGFLRAINFRCTHSFGWEVKPEAPCPKILRHVKEPCVVWWRFYVS
jgi:hypothetical protein